MLFIISTKLEEKINRKNLKKRETNIQKAVKNLNSIYKGTLQKSLDLRMSKLNLNVQ